MENLVGYGGFRSEYASLMFQELPPLILVGTGAGCAYLIDFHQYILANDIELKKPVQMLISSRSVTLFQFITDYLP
eukprot:UN14740